MYNIILYNNLLISQLLYIIYCTMVKLRDLLWSPNEKVSSRQYYQGSIKENWEGLVAVVARVAQWLWRLQPDTLGSSPSAAGFSPFSPFPVEQAELH